MGYIVVNKNIRAVTAIRKLCENWPNARNYCENCSFWRLVSNKTDSKSIAKVALELQKLLFMGGKWAVSRSIFAMCRGFCAKCRTDADSWQGVPVCGHGAIIARCKKEREKTRTKNRERKKQRKRIKRKNKREKRKNTLSFCRFCRLRWYSDRLINALYCIYCYRAMWLYGFIAVRSI